MTLRIWCSAHDFEALPPLSDAVRAPELDDADVAYGQPALEACLLAGRLRWVHLRSAGWDRFDSPRVREHFASRGVVLTNSSSVYQEPCAQHVLAMLLAEARQLGRSFTHQATDRAWPQLETRADCRLLGPETRVVLVGFGTIAARVAELLVPFGAQVVGVRRSPTGTERVPVLPMAQWRDALASAEHVVNILPGGDASRGAFGAEQFAVMRAGAVFYNIGRGSTVDQAALLTALASGRLRAAYLDVMDPEPLPPEHPLWSARGCYVTPHAAGGHATESARLSAHFEQNLRRFRAGEPLVDRVL